MSRRPAVRCLLCVGLWAILPGQPGSPSILQSPSTDSTQTAAAAGVVVEGESGRPLKNAIVTATHAGSRIVQTTVTDDAGGFTFLALPAGRVSFSASKPAFVQPPWRPARASSTFSVGGGQHLRNVVVLLERGAAISGTIRDPDGTPLPASGVRLFRCNGFGTTCDNPRPLQGELADLAGGYRFFGLRVGRYLVMAVARQDGNAQQPIQAPASEALLDEAERLLRRGARITAREMAAITPEPATSMAMTPTYFPAASEPTLAAIVTVGPGEERGFVDITMQTGALGRISGRVRDERGQPLQTDRLVFFSSTGSRPIVTAQDGSFSTGPLQAGRVRLLLSVDRPSARRLMGETSIEVNGDMENVEVQLRPTVAIHGRVELLAGARSLATDLSGVRLHLRRDAPLVISNFDIATAQSRKDGTFTLEGLRPGRYHVTSEVGQRQAGHLSVVAVTAGGRDVLDGILDVPATRAPALTVTLTDRTTVVSGTVRDQAGMPVTEYLVVLFPADRSLWGSTRRIRSGRPASDGSFEFSGMPAGSYLLALAGVDVPEDIERSLLELLLPTAQYIQIEAGRSVQMPLVVRSDSNQ